IKVEMERPKTEVNYWSLLWHDAVDSLNALLLERIRETGDIPEKLFVTQYGTPIDEHDIATTVRFLANTSGLDPTKEGVKEYRIRPHAFRHYFKTTCTENKVEPIVSEFLLGHGGKEIGRVYDEFMETEKG